MIWEVLSCSRRMSVVTKSSAVYRVCELSELTKFFELVIGRFVLIMVRAKGLTHSFSPLICSIAAACWLSSLIGTLRTTTDSSNLIKRSTFMIVRFLSFIWETFRSGLPTLFGGTIQLSIWRLLCCVASIATPMQIEKGHPITRDSQKRWSRSIQNTKD
jgi:hypothetical protein